MNEPIKGRWERDPGFRWEHGVPHHPESVKLMDEINEMDWKYLKGHFDFKTGGDGDEGETLMFLMDMIFERRDEQKDRPDSP